MYIEAIIRDTETDWTLNRLYYIGDIPSSDKKFPAYYERGLSSTGAQQSPVLVGWFSDINEARSVIQDQIKDDGYEFVEWSK